MIAFLKQFINSTIGTAEMTPLDQQIRAISAVITGGVGLKSVQRGVYYGDGAASVTINAVNPDKTIVLSASKGSTGYAAVRGEFQTSDGFSTGSQSGMQPGYGSRIGGTISPGNYQSNLTVKVYSARLTSATTITCDGWCEWQVVEFY
ncbi:MAG: hypothetical protein LBK41_07030 [Clostridiales bacterium]|jgi:hypothetical protein|nr:hypothetical protein [Clostridiales bacterium]